jgi:hypothetical protein|tara:strand:+ start:793 stop:1140 length:348 start_codon:yes stop_codon:yes gene_type:complete
MITRDKLKGFKEEEYIEAIMQLCNSGIKTRAIAVQLKQLEDIIQYLEENSLVKNISDKDDKSFDRLKKILEDLDVYTNKIDLSQQQLIELNKEEDLSVVRKGKSITDYVTTKTKG